MANASQHPIGDIAIVGDGLDAWVSAAYLSRKLANVSARITVCPVSAQEEQAPPALSSTPHLCAFHQELGIDERDLVRFCQATFRLGTQFLNWTKNNADYVVAFGAYGAPLETVAFHHYWLKARNNGSDVRYDRYALAAEAARAEKFAHPSTDESDIRSTYGYGLHLDRERYANYMRKFATHYGVQTAGAPFQRAAVSETGVSISEITLSNGETIQPWLVLDCSGQKAVIAGDVMKAQWRAYTPLSKLDMTGEIRTRSETSPSLTSITANGAGWMSDTPLQHDTCRTVAFDKNAPLSKTFENTAAASKVQPITSGRRTPWTGNAVAIGEAAARLDPLANPRLETLTAGLMRLMELLPAGAPTCEPAEYNRIMQSVFDRCYDFQALQYWIAETMGGHPWAEGAEKAETALLGRKRRQFESRGRVVQYDEETFNDDAWISSFIGGGLIPRRHDPLADNVPDHEISAKLEALRKAIADASGAIPRQMDYLHKAKAVAPVRSEP